MKGTFKLDNPDEMEATLTVTLTVGEWGLVNETLRQRGTSLFGTYLSNLISDLINKAQSEITAEGPGE